MKTMNTSFPIDKLRATRTPFYFYDSGLLRRTLKEVSAAAAAYKDFIVHYAVKANANPKVLRIVSEAGLGVDCVSGGEIKAALQSGFNPTSIVFAGVGKADWEINAALDAGIFCFNVESVPELEIINQLAEARGMTASVCFRINPEVGAHTHANITTGLAENKFGIAMSDMVPIIEETSRLKNVKFIGLHFHIGSQILDMDDFRLLCLRINELQEALGARHIEVENINVGGGLGIDYDDPDKNPIPNFKSYFKVFAEGLRLKPNQKVHFELGRSIVGQMGSLITKVLYVKQGVNKQFCIVDAGMTDLIRPALYHAHHYIENLTGHGEPVAYDIVGPICESSDVFAKDTKIAQCKRGDLLAIRSAGAYGEIMASQYNCRPLPKGLLSQEL